MKIQSRHIDDCRPDVAVNIKTGIHLCVEAGFPIGIAATYRNQEYQTWLYEQGKAPARVAFHGYGLAFDIYLDIPGHEYDTSMYVVPMAMFKKVGFSAMWDIAHNEMCHFQWDDHRKYHNADLFAGRMPPDMPAYQEDLMSQFIENMAIKYQKTTSEVENALESILQIALHTPATWEHAAADVLTNKGLALNTHDPREIVTFATLGAMEGRRK